MRRLLILGLVLMLGVTLAVAQDKKFEVSPYIGGTLSDGVDVDPTSIPGTEPPLTVDRVSPKSGLSWGVGFDFLATENFAVGFNFSQHFSKLRAGLQEGGDRDLADLDVFNYHGTFTYNIGDEQAPVRPFVFGGLGATQYRSGDLELADVPSPAQTVTVSETRFSTTWGGGVKFQPNQSVGFKLTGRWTPTYIKTDPAGIWCDPYWWGACWVVGNSQYSNQFELSAGVVFRF